MSANIIKAATKLANTTGIKKEVYDASLEARQILERARIDAEMLVAQAKADRKSVAEEAKETGYAAGLAQWNEILVEAWQRRDQYLDQNESELVRLAVAAAKRIIGEEIRSNPSAILNTVREVVRSAGRQRGLTIQVNPAQESIVAAQTENLRILSHGAPDLTISGNASVEEGGCIVETDIGRIDARLSTQLTALEQALMRRMRP